MGEESLHKPEHFTSFGDLLRHLREDVRLTQRELAQEVGYHYSYISRLEKNERSPDSATLMALFIPALGLEDEPAWTARLLELAESGDKSTFKRTRSPLSPPTPDTPASNISLPFRFPLPISINPLLGRAPEVEALCQLLLDDDVRLVTLIGAPGVGKTRLALHVANQLQDRFSHGALFIDLTKVNDPEGVLPAFADALGVSEASESQLNARVVNALRQKNILFVVDNFEHVLDASSQFVQLLGNSPQVKAIATSREALNIPGEREFLVKPLPIPQADDDAFEQFPSIQLFIQRARAVQPDFQLTKENKNVIVEICRRLDGLPLAIELAAPRVKALTPQAMLKQFERRLDWEARSAQFQKQTLRGALEWSYNLLTEPAQVLLRRLAVFSGGWTVDSADVVCADSDGSDSSVVHLPRADVVGLLIQLLDKSLISVEHGEPETRYRFLETIRDFAREKLSQSLEERAVKNKHLAYFADFAEMVESHFTQPDRMEWIRRGEEEHSNIVTALEWGLRNETALRDGLRLIAAVNRLWMTSSRFREGLEYSKSYLQGAHPENHRALKAKMLSRGGAMAGYIYDHVTAYAMCEEAVSICRALNDPRELAAALYYFSEPCHQLGKMPQARAALEECMAICREHNDHAQLGLALTTLGLVHDQMGDYTNAVQVLQDALSLASHHNDPWTLSRALLNLGTIHRFHRNYADAIPYFQRSLDVLVELGDKNAEGFTSSNLSILYRLEEDYVESGRYAERAYAVFQSLGDDVQLPFPLRMMGYSAIHAGNLVRARVLIQESLAGNRLLEHGPGQVACLVAMANYHLAESDVVRAVSLCALAETRMQADGFKLLEPDEKTLREALAEGMKRLDAAAYQSAYAQGQSMQLENEIMNLLGKQNY